MSMPWTDIDADIIPLKFLSAQIDVGHFLDGTWYALALLFV